MHLQARILRAVFCALLLALPWQTMAAEQAGRVLQMKGRATLTTATGEIRGLRRGASVSPKDIISTSRRSFVRMKMKDGTYLMVRPDSRLSIDDFEYRKDKPKQNRGFFSLLKGGFRAVTGFIKNKKKYLYRTTVATIGIRGTDFSVRVCSFDCYDIDPVPENGLFLEVHDSKVIITTEAGDFAFTQGQYAYVANSKAPAVLLDAPPDVFEQKPIPSPEAECDQ